MQAASAAGRVASKPDRSKYVKKFTQQVREDRVLRRRKRRGLLIHAKAKMLREETESATDPRELKVSQLADQIWARGGKLVGTATNISFVPDGNPAVPEVMLCGRSGVGKTALLRALFKARTPVSNANHTIRRACINFFSVGGVFNIAETPGYGGATVPWTVVLEHAVLLRNYARCRPSLKMIYFCMDASTRTGLFMRDVDTLKFLQEECPNFTIVATKADSLSSLDRRQGSDVNFGPAELKEELLRNGIEHPLVSTSAFDMGGIDTLRYDMVAQALHSLPTDRLSLTEARRLSERLFDQRQLATVRQLNLPLTQRDEELIQWRLQSQQDSSPAALPLASSKAVASEADAGISREAETQLLANRDGSQEDALAMVKKTVANDALMKFVHETSPWRNPLLWPANVTPTKSRRSNIMRSPQDPANPYLYQPHFVAPRTDMFFRKPNISVYHTKKKGLYVQEPEKPRYVGTTIPHFPQIVDVRMHPAPWMFLGSRDRFYESVGGRQLGIAMQQKALSGKIDPLANVPSRDPELNKEVARLEEKRYGAPIAFLRPRGMPRAGSVGVLAALSDNALATRSGTPAGGPASEAVGALSGAERSGAGGSKDHDGPSPSLNPL